MSGHKWADPAPFEGVRPHLPWWFFLPRWVKVVLLPLGLALPVVARLATLGLITDEATTYAALGKWQITTFGIRCLTALLEVGYTATEDDGEQDEGDS